MTTVNTTDRTSLTANGTTPLPFTFQALSSDEVGVMRNDVVASPLTYTVALNGDGTGTVTPTSTWGTDSVIIFSNPNFQQLADFVRFGPFYPDQFVTPLDRLARGLIALRGRLEQADPVGNSLRADLLAASGSTLVNTTNGATGARTISAQVKMDLHLDAREFTGTWDGIADDTTGLQAAVNEAIVRDATLHLPRAIKHGAITLNGKCKIKGDGGKTTLYSIAGGYPLFTLSSSDVVFEDLYIDEAAKSSGATFLIACGSTRKERITLENINTFNSYQLLADSGTGSGDLVTLRLKSVQARLHRGPGVKLTRLAAFGFFNEVAVEYIGVSASDYTGFEFDGSGLGSATGGVFLDTCDVLGTSGTYANTSQKGFVVKNHAEFHAYNSRADTCDGDGWDINNINIVAMDDCAASICNGHGFIFTTVTNAIIDKLSVRGRKNLTSPAASKDGIQFVSGCGNMQIGTSLVRDLTGHGINKVAAQAAFIQLSGVQSISNTGRGIKTVGASAFHMIGGATVGNTAGNYDLGNALDIMSNVVGNSGSLINATGVATG
jgi:hypothetical protein